MISCIRFVYMYDFDSLFMTGRVGLYMDILYRIGKVCSSGVRAIGVHFCYYIASKTTSHVYFSRSKSHGFVYNIDRPGGLYYVSFSCRNCGNQTNIIKFIEHKNYLIMFLFSYCAVSFNRALCYWNRFFYSPVRMKTRRLF